MIELGTGKRKLPEDKELLQAAVLKVISEAKFISAKVVLQGGNALRLCYNGMRFSNDLDFVMNNTAINEKDVKELVSLLSKNLKRYIINPYKVKYAENKPIYKIMVEVKSQKRAAISVTVEFVVSIKAYESRTKIAKARSLPSIQIFTQVESQEEILADKIVAFGGRGLIKGMPFKARDVWDIFWLLSNNVHIRNELIVKKIKEYNIPHFRQIFEQRLTALNNPRSLQYFINEMSRFLDEDAGVTLSRNLAEEIINRVSLEMKVFIDNFREDSFEL